MTEWLHYWTRPQIESELDSGRLSHIASDQFESLAAGDRVWVVTALEDVLFTIGYVRVEEVVTLDEARKRVPNAWNAKWHVFAGPATAVCAYQVNLSRVAYQLRFRTARGTTSLERGKLLGQQLQRMRRLTPESAVLIERAWQRGTGFENDLGLFAGITREDCIRAIERIDGGLANRFGASRKYDLLFDDRRYPPKAVLGVAAERARGRILAPSEFSGGVESKCHRVLLALDFVLARKAGDDAYPDEVEEERFREGRALRVYVNRYERDKRARARCIAHYGPVCQVCDLRFVEMYGEIGAEFIHVHHLEQIAEAGGEHEVDPIADLRPVCPNCHAMLHQTRPPMRIETLREVVHRRQRGDRPRSSDACWVESGEPCRRCEGPASNPLRREPNPRSDRGH